MNVKNKKNTNYKLFLIFLNIGNTNIIWFGFFFENDWYNLITHKERQQQIYSVNRNNLIVEKKSQINKIYHRMAHINNNIRHSFSKQKQVRKNIFDFNSIYSCSYSSFLFKNYISKSIHKCIHRKVITWLQ